MVADPAGAGRHATQRDCHAGPVTGAQWVRVPGGFRELVTLGGGRLWRRATRRAGGAAARGGGDGGAFVDVTMRFHDAATAEGATVTSFEFAEHEAAASSQTGGLGLPAAAVGWSDGTVTAHARRRRPGTRSRSGSRGAPRSTRGCFRRALALARLTLLAPARLGSVSRTAASVYDARDGETTRRRAAAAVARGSGVAPARARRGASRARGTSRRGKKPLDAPDASDAIAVTAADGPRGWDLSGSPAQAATMRVRGRALFAAWAGAGAARRARARRPRRWSPGLTTRPFARGRWMTRRTPRRRGRGRRAREGGQGGEEARQGRGGAAGGREGERGRRRRPRSRKRIRGPGRPTPRGKRGRIRPRAHPRVPPARKNARARAGAGSSSLPPGKARRRASRRGATPRCVWRGCWRGGPPQRLPASPRPARPSLWTTRAPGTARGDSVCTSGRKRPCVCCAWRSPPWRAATAPGGRVRKPPGRRAVSASDAVPRRFPLPTFQEAGRFALPNAPPRRRCSAGTSIPPPSLCSRRTTDRFRPISSPRSSAAGALYARPRAQADRLKPAASTSARLCSACPCTTSASSPRCAEGGSSATPPRSRPRVSFRSTRSWRKRAWRSPPLRRPGRAGRRRAHLSAGRVGAAVRALARPGAGGARAAAEVALVMGARGEPEKHAVIRAAKDAAARGDTAGAAGVLGAGPSAAFPAARGFAGAGGARPGGGGPGAKATQRSGSYWGRSEYRWSMGERPRKAGMTVRGTSRGRKTSKVELKRSTRERRR